MEEKKKKSYYNEKQNKRTQAYIHDKYDQVSVRIPKGRKVEYQAVLNDQGISLNKYILDKLEELLQ